MTYPEQPRMSWRDKLFFLLPCLAAALAVRWFFFGAITLADDVNYWMQIISTGLDNAWPPERTHWHTRIGFILPCALLVKIFGLKIWVPFLFTLLAGLLEIALAYFIARQFVSEKAARLAAWLMVFFPLNIIYSGYLLLDLWSGLLAAISLCFWWRALKTDGARDYALASIFFGLGWLVRETVIMSGPIYIALWVHAGRWMRPKMLWSIPFGLFFLAGEMALYQFTIHNWHYRFDAILNAKAQMLEDVSNDSGFIRAPLVQLVASHELGLFFIGGLAVAILAYRHFSKPLACWAIVGFAWLSWGTASPAGWIPMQRDPRYLSMLTIPCLALLSAWVLNLRSANWRRIFIAVFMVSGLFCATLDVGRVKSSAHRRFARSEYNTPNTTAEPFVYFGIRATQNFSEDVVKICYADDLGRSSGVKLMPHLPGARLLSCSQARYAIFSAQTQPEKWRAKINEGWREVAEIPGETVFSRKLILRSIAKLRGRASNNSDPGLIVLENPSFVARQ